LYKSYDDILTKIDIFIKYLFLVLLSNKVKPQT